MIHKLVHWALTGVIKRRHRKLKARVASEMSDRRAVANNDLIRATRPWDHAPDFVIGTWDDPYLYRWYIVPPHGMWPLGWLRKAFPKSKLARAIAERFAVNVYLHRFMRSDDDRALHDHPWANISLLLEGSYMEHVFQEKPKGVTNGHEYNVPETWIKMHTAGGWGGLSMRSAETAHRIELFKDKQGKEQPVWSLFITGRKERSWGFWCPKSWRHWENFVAEGKDIYAKGQSSVGAGCE